MENKMNDLAKQNNVFIRKEISKHDAVQYFEDKGDEYKLDLLQGLTDGEITFIHKEVLQIYAAVRIYPTLVL